MAKWRKPPSQGWKTFVHNHASGFVSIDLFVVPTLSFRLLYGLAILRHDRCRLLWLNVTTNPTSERMARQLTEALGWDEAARYLIRDRPTALRSPWQNGCTERLIGSIRRECLDHVVILGERHLRHVLSSYMNYYNVTRTHLSLAKDPPSPRPIVAVGRIAATPILGGLHHHYSRI